MNTMVSAVSVASALPVAAALVNTGGPSGPDPIYAAIDAHRRAIASYEAALRRQEELVNTIPKELRQTDYQYGVDFLLTHDDDDDDWKANENALRDSDLAEDAAALALLEIEPTTLAGLTALLRYAAEAVDRGFEWPSDLVDDDAQGAVIGKDWSRYLHLHLAGALEKLSTASGVPAAALS